MQEKEKKAELIPFMDVKPIELERILSLYGMKKQDYCNLRSKTKSWFHNVLRKKKFLSYLDVKTLTDSIGIDTFCMLLEKTRQKYPSQNKQEI